MLTEDLVHVLRRYEKERKSRTRIITVRSNLMGQALQIPFPPVSLRCKAGCSAQWSYVPCQYHARDTELLGTASTSQNHSVSMLA